MPDWLKAVTSILSVGLKKVPFIINNDVHGYTKKNEQGTLNSNQFQGEEKKHGEEINFLKRTNQQLKAQLEGIISQKK